MHEGFYIMYITTCCFDIDYVISDWSYEIHVVMKDSQRKKSPYPPGNDLASHRYWWPDTLITAWVPASKVKGHQYQWLAGGYDLDIGYL